MTERTGRPRPRTYDKHPAPVWEAIRRGYVGGETVPRLAERFGVKTAIIYWRSREHGWREERDAAQARARQRAWDDVPPWADLSMSPSQWSPPPGWFDGATPPRPDRPPASPTDAARDAFSRSAQAMQQDRPDEAQRWARLATQMNRLAPADPAPSPAPTAARDPGPSLTERYPIPPGLEKAMAPFVEGGAAYRAQVYASARAKQDDPGHYSEDLTPDEAAMLGGEHFVPGGNAPTDPDHVDDGLDLFRYYRPGKGTSWEKLTALAEKRLDMLVRDMWTGGRWDDALGLPDYVFDPRVGRIARTADLPEAGELFAPPGDVEAVRALFDRPMPPVADLPAPPLRWIIQKWLPSWNEEHPADPCTALQAMTIHQLWTRDPRLEAELIPEEQFHARILWEERWAKDGVEPVRPKNPWTEADEAREAERERVWAAVKEKRAAQRVQARAEYADAGEEPPPEVRTVRGGFRVRVL
ncbi:MAG: hypothetical protein Q8J89_07360 [Caulobacter sp.]|nr:hypothetical protein [Caulobacter sp.]